MSSILHTYYEGLTKQIQAELDYMNNIISHMGEKGKANENARARAMYHDPAKSHLKLRKTHKKDDEINPTYTLLNFLKRLYEKLKEKRIQKETILFHYLEEDFFKDYDI